MEEQQARPLRAIVAKRLSRLTDATTHLVTEAASIEAFCKRKNFVIVAATEDLDVSGGKPIRERPGVGAWLTEDHLDEWDVLVIYKLDRGFRNHLDFVTFYHEYCVSYGKKIISVSEEGVDMSTNTGRMFAGMLVQFAEWELMSMKDRRAAAAKVLREEARWGGGTFPFGYIPYQVEQGGKKAWYLKPHPVYAKEVLWMAESIVTGRSLGSIVKSLIARGIPSSRDVQNDFFGRPSKNYKWNTTQVIHILRSDLTRGYVMHRIHGPNKPPSRVIDPVTGDFIRREPLIGSDEFWAELQAALDACTKKLSGVRDKGSALLQIAFCGYCGAPLYQGGRGQAKDRKHNVPYYQCRYMRTTCKPSRSVPRAALDNTVHTALLDTVGDCELTERKIIQGDDHTQALVKLGVQMADLTKQHFAFGGVPDYHRKMAEFEAEHERISAMSKEPPVIKRISTGKTFRQRWEEMDDEQRHSYLKSSGVSVLVVRAEDFSDIGLVFTRTTDTADDVVLDIPLNIIREFTGPPPARSQAPKPGKFVVNISLGTLRGQLQRATRAGE
jgi:site-specific DNA recombinase